MIHNEFWYLLAIVNVQEILIAFSPFPFQHLKVPQDKCWFSCRTSERVTAHGEMGYFSQKNESRRTKKMRHVAQRNESRHV